MTGLGFPFNTKIEDQEKIYISDYCVENSKLFFYGFALAVISTPSTAFADDTTKQLGEAAARGMKNTPTPAPGFGPAHAPT